MSFKATRLEGAEFPSWKVEDEQSKYFYVEKKGERFHLIGPPDWPCLWPTWKSLAADGIPRSMIVEAITKCEEGK